MRRKTLLNVLLLSGTSFGLRAVGMVFRVYLTGRLGVEGIGLYQLISSLYMLTAMLCSTGLSTAITRLVAERESQARAIVRKATHLSLYIGLLLGLLQFALAGPLGRYALGDARTSLSLRVVSFALPCIAVSSCLRGYFMGRDDVLRPTIAQVLEQFFRISLVLVLLEANKEADLGVSCAIVMGGCAAGEAFSTLLYLILYARSRRDLPRCGAALSPQLMGIALPILMATLIQSGMQTAENLLIPQGLRQYTGSASRAMEQYGMLGGMVMPILFFPAALPGAIGTLRLPQIARLHAQGRKEPLRELTLRTIHQTLALSLLFCAFFVALSQPLALFLYGSDIAGGILLLLSPLLPLLYLDKIADALLKGIGRQKTTLYVEIADSTLRLAMIVLLLPRVGMAGYLVLMYASSLLTAGLRLARLFAACGFTAKDGRAALRRVLPCALAAAAACFCGLLPAGLALSPGWHVLAGGAAVGLSFLLLYFLLTLRSRARRAAAA